MPRCILMRFHHYKDKLLVLSKKKILKDQNIFVSEDYPEEVVKRRKVIVPIYYRALELCPNLSPKLRVDKLILGGREYGVHNINTVPIGQLQPKFVFTKEQNGMTAYFTNQSPLSNHYACDFYENGLQFKSSEQCFMYHKASLFKDEETAKKILEAESPEKAKALGKRIIGFNAQTWKEASSECMFKAMMAKFSSNPEIRSFLLQTQQTTLVEASPTDTVWGIGLPLQNPQCFSPEKWRGKNLAGKVLERVRQSLN